MHNLVAFTAKGFNSDRSKTEEGREWRGESGGSNIESRYILREGEI
jgi:hypothetical protein